MSVASTSLVTQLLYRSAPYLDFGRVMAGLADVLATEDGKRTAVSWDCDDIAVFDLPDARLVIGFSDLLPGIYQACTTVAVGASRIPAAKVMSDAGQHALGRAIVEHLQGQFPTDDQRLFNVDHALTPDLIDHLVEALCQESAPAPSLSHTTGLSDPPKDAPEAVDVDRLLHRFSSELTTRAPSLITRAIASATKNGRKPDVAVSSLPKAKGGLFWRKGEPAPIDIEVKHGSQSADLVATAGELKAVRDALYAQDASSGSRAFATTKRALLSLVAGAANKGPDEQVKQ